MSELHNNKSIKETLNVIRKALQEDNLISEENIEKVLVLDQLVKEDGTIEILNDNNFEKEEIKEILNEKLTEVFGSGTAVTIGKIKSINSSLGKIDLSSHKVTEELKKSLLDIQYGKTNDPFDWRKKIM